MHGLPVSIAIYCADPGSVRNDSFGWWGGSGGNEQGGRLPSQLATAMAADLRSGKTVLLGFESPLSFPVPFDEQQLGSARPGESNRPWSAGAGATIATYGAVQLGWVLRALREQAPDGTLLADWNQVMAGHAGLYLFEAFVSGHAKTKGSDSHIGDARLAVEAVRERGMPIDQEWMKTTVPVFCVGGAALLQAGWAHDLHLMSRPLPIVFVGSIR